MSIANVRSLLCRKKQLCLGFATKRLYSNEKVIFLDEAQLQALDRDLLETVELKDLAISKEPVIRGSPEAEYGRKKIGSIAFPKPLIKGVTELIQEQDKRLVRTDALRLYESFRSTARPQETDDRQKKKKDTEPHTLTYGARESVAYAAGAMPSAFAASLNVLTELSRRISDFKPKTMLDFGTGPGTAIWAARQVFELDKCTGVDLSEDMLRIAERLETYLSEDKAQEPVEFKRYLGFDPQASKPDLVVSAFTLGEIPSIALQKSVVEQLWDQTGDILVIIDRGTPVGFANVARARQWLLDSPGEKGAHVVAPCPHDGPCPLLFSPDAKLNKYWCHFSQKVQRPPFLMKTKHSKFNEEDAKYAYVILRRGPRPRSSDATDSLETKAYEWPRLIQPPLKKHGHVVMDTCASSGAIERIVIPKSQGKIPYRDARKAAWGDAFPHPPKNKPVTRISKGIIQEPETQ